MGRGGAHLPSRPGLKSAFSVRFAGKSGPFHKSDMMHELRLRPSPHDYN